MFQETWVLQCYSCKIFQCHLKKKAKRWQCKVCGAKQDFIHIFFKGCPSDCRINVQRINKAEGEKLMDLQEQSIYQHQNENDDKCESTLHNFEDENDIFYNNLQKSLVVTDDETHTVTETYSQETINVEDINDTKDISNEHIMLDTQLSNISDNVNINTVEDLCNTNSTDFTMKSLNNDISKRTVNKNCDIYVPKLSIFESYNALDEHLDF